MIRYRCKGDHVVVTGKCDSPERPRTPFAGVPQQQFCPAFCEGLDRSRISDLQMQPAGIIDDLQEYLDRET